MTYLKPITPSLVSSAEKILNIEFNLENVNTLFGPHVKTHKVVDEDRNLKFSNYKNLDCNGLTGKAKCAFKHNLVKFELNLTQIFLEVYHLSPVLFVQSIPEVYHL